MRSWSSALLLLTKPRPPRSPPFPYTTLFRSNVVVAPGASVVVPKSDTRLKPPGRLIGSDRSEERRVGKECGTGWVTGMYKKELPKGSLPPLAKAVLPSNTRAAGTDGGSAWYG